MKNTAEGYVIKAEVSLPCSRGALKVKHPDFAEFIGFTPKGRDDTVKTNLKEFHLDKIKQYLTQHRLDSVRSKYDNGIIIPNLIGCFISDALSDYTDSLDEDAKKEYKKVQKDCFKDLQRYCNENFNFQS